MWGAPYPWGALAAGRIGPVLAQAAVLNSAPSSEPETWGLEGSFRRAPNLVGRASLEPAPELRLSVSYSRGPYLQDEAEQALPPEREVDDYQQRIGGLEVEFTRGLVVVRGELFLDRWEVPNVATDVDELSWYLEGTFRPVAGLSLSARYGELRFGRLDPASGDGGYGGPSGPKWDRDFSRTQLAAEYRIVRNLGVKGEYAINRTSGPEDPPDDLAALQLWWAF